MTFLFRDDHSICDLDRMSYELFLLVGSVGKSGSRLSGSAPDVKTATFVRMGSSNVVVISLGAINKSVEVKR